MNKSYLLIILIVAVVVVSGCAAKEQADLVKTSFEKAAALEKGPGYSADYKMTFSFSMNDNLKSYISKTPGASQGLGTLENIKINMKLSEAVSDNGTKQKLSMDLTDILALTASKAPANQVIPKKYAVSIYKSGDTSTVCLEFDNAFWKSLGQDVNAPVCASANSKDASGLSGLGSLLTEFNQYSSSSPTALLESLESLYKKGLLKVGAMTDGSAAGRPCKSAAFSIEDFSKLSDEDMLKIAGSGAQSSGIPTQGVGQAAIEQGAKLLKSMIKEVSNDLCFDTENGLPIKINVVVGIDMSAMFKAIVGSLDPSKASEFPDNAIMKSIISLEATSVKTPSTSADTTPPSTAKMVSELELEQMLSPPSSGLGGDLEHPAASKTSITKKLDDKFSAYEDLAKGFKFKYPNDWTLVERENDVQILSPTKIENIILTSQKTQITSTITLDYFTDSVLSLLKTTYGSSFNLVEKASTSFVNAPASKLIYTIKVTDDATGTQVPIKGMTIIALKNDNVYTFAYTATETTYSSLLSLVEEIATSVVERL